MGAGGRPSSATSTARQRGAQTRKVASPPWRLAPGAFIRSNGGTRGLRLADEGCVSMSYPFALVLHTHLPMVVNHGRWPHGSDWLCEAAFECYLPLLETAHRLVEDCLSAEQTVSISPVLTEQLAAPAFE